MSKLFEQMLNDDWAIDRKDIYVEGILPLDLLSACQPVRPHALMRLLGVSESQVIALLSQGLLPRPGKRGHGRVAWRFDEIEALRERLSLDVGSKAHL